MELPLKKFLNEHLPIKLEKASLPKTNPEKEALKESKIQAFLLHVISGIKQKDIAKILSKSEPSINKYVTTITTFLHASNNEEAQNLLETVSQRNQLSSDELADLKSRMNVFLSKNLPCDLKNIPSPEGSLNQKTLKQSKIQAFLLSIFTELTQEAIGLKINKSNTSISFYINEVRTFLQTPEIQKKLEVLLQNYF